MNMQTKFLSYLSNWANFMFGIVKSLLKHFIISQFVGVGWINNYEN